MPKRAGGRAGSLQKTLGQGAQSAFQALVDQKLKLPSGKQRDLMLRTADEPFDSYGRLLAYVAPGYSPRELAQMTPQQRATFNLLMIQAGWGAPMVIYPSLPKLADLEMLQQGAKAAVDGKLGAWAEPLYLAGYEFRMCVRLFDITAQLVGGKKLTKRQRMAYVDRSCADMTTLALYPPQRYHEVAPYNRLFVWARDLKAAARDLNLTPAS